MARRAKEDDDILDQPTGSERRAADSYIQLSFQLPAFYVRVLDSEAAYLSQRRSVLLELLVLKNAGRIKVERSPNAPKYRLDRRELQVMKRYVWHCRPEINEHLDRLRARIGNLPASAWIMLALNEWIGMPAGLGSE